MRALLVISCLILSQNVLAADFTVKDPVYNGVRVAVPVQNITCVAGPCRSAQLKIALTSPVGEFTQTGILESPFQLGKIFLEDCRKILTELKADADRLGQVNLRADIIDRSVIRSVDEGRTTSCMGAEQEIVRISINAIDTYESVVHDETHLDCPEGFAGQYINSIDKVIYVLHANGIPSRAGF